MAEMRDDRLKTIDASSPLHALLPPCLPVLNNFTNALETDGPTDLRMGGLTEGRD